uniref:Uncharacterized protein n=1 Tax=Lepeophtheirus salmonis TaxID=72036 RepID=A0A0K2UVA3_LEPSM
MRKISEEEFG